MHEPPHSESHTELLILAGMEEKIRFALHPSFVSHVVGIMGVHREVCQKPHLPELLVIVFCLVDLPPVW
jgi:hypothetical protein